MASGTSCSSPKKKGPSNSVARRPWTAFSIDPMAVLAWTAVVICILIVKGLDFSRDEGRLSNGKAQHTVVGTDLGPHRDARELLFFRPLDLNAATAEELTLLSGIGAVRAWQVVQFRQEMGFLVSVNELAAPEGPLPLAVLSRLAPYLSIGDPPPVTPEVHR